MTKRKFTPPTEFPAEYFDGNGNKSVILGRGPSKRFPFIGYDANGYAATWTELGNYHHGRQSTGDLYDDGCGLVKRLHSLHKQDTVERSHFYVGSCAEDAMHRIEELEAKLAKAVAELERLGFDFGSIVGRELEGETK